MIAREIIATAAVVTAMSAGTALSATPPPAWKHEVDSGIHYAFFNTGSQELAVRCNGNAVEVVYYIDGKALDPALVGANSAVLEVLSDEADLAWVNGDVIVDNNIVQVGVGGDAANDLAHTLGGAKSSLVVSLTTEEPKPTSMQYDRAAVPITGAADAIKAAYKGCGISY